jgi:hypothetical protein
MQGIYRFQVWACASSPVSSKDQAGWGPLCYLYILPAYHGITYQGWYGLRYTGGAASSDWETAPFESFYAK